MDKKTGCVHVAVALIIKDHQVLIALRPAHVDQGGLWEFPGGKLEAGETVEQALHREIKEELDIDIQQAQPWLKISHKYKNKTVLLDVWKIEHFTGEPRGAEDQPVQWLNINQLKTEYFPAANRAIIHSLQCSELYLITGAFDSQDDFAHRLKKSLEQSAKLVQLRCKSIESASEYVQLARQASLICQQFTSPLLLNASVEVFQSLSDCAQGLHLSSRRLFDYDSRPIAMDKILSVSCHSAAEILQAERLSADIILISPVKETRSHPGVAGIGWDKFYQLAKNINSPVYALGGMGLRDLQQAKSSAAQGIAAISEFWSR